MKFFNSPAFNKWVSIVAMLSKYGIAAIVVIMLHAWKFIPVLLAASILATIVGLLLAWILSKRAITWVKYIVIAAEYLSFGLIMSWAVLWHTVQSPIITAMTLPLLGNFTGQIKRTCTDKKPQNGFLRVLDTILLSEEMFAVERAAKVVVGAYFSFIFGLQNIWIEAIILAGFGIIGSVEIDVKERMKVFSRWYAYLKEQAIYHLFESPTAVAHSINTMATQGYCDPDVSYSLMQRAYEREQAHTAWHAEIKTRKESKSK